MAGIELSKKIIEVILLSNQNKIFVFDSNFDPIHNVFEPPTRFLVYSAIKIY